MAGLRRSLWDSSGLDLKHVLRAIRLWPGFTALVVGTLAVGIAANAVMFGVVDRLLLRPPPHVAEPDRVARIYFHGRAPTWMNQAYITEQVTTYPLVAALRTGVPSLQEVAGYVSRSGLTVGRGSEAEQADGCLVTGNFFQLLGARAVHGRFFGPAEDRPAVGTPVAVLSYSYWQRRFGGEDVLGKQLLIEKTLFTIIGVAPRGFTGVDSSNVDVWLPVSSLAAVWFGQDWYTNPSAWWIQAIARLAPRATRERASAEATAAFQRTVRSWPDGYGRDSSGQVIAGHILAARGPQDMPVHARVSLWLIAVAVIVLLIACANVANLLLVRSMHRRRAMAVQLAIGIGRARLFGQLVTEAVVLALFAATTATVLTYSCSRAMQAALLSGVAWEAEWLDWRVLAFTMFATFSTILLAAVAPAVQATRLDLVSSLKVGTPEAGGPHSRLRATLVVAQAALCAMLLVGAGLFVRSLARLQALDVGIDLQRVFLVRIDLHGVGMGPEEIRQLFRTAKERVTHFPGVESAAMVGESVPMLTAQATGVLRLPGVAQVPPVPNGGPYHSAVDAQYFSTIGARIVRGRGFTAADIDTHARVAVVNETLAHHLWPNEGALNQCLLLEMRECTRVVGIVQDVLHFRLISDQRAMYYLPLTHSSLAGSAPSAMLFRARLGAQKLPAAVRREIQGLAPGLPYVEVRSFAEMVAPQLQPWRLGASMFGVFGMLALAIAAVGLHSVIAYLVVYRTREIGLRIAVGARTRDVIWLVLREGARMGGIGVATGLALSLAVSPWVEPLLYRTSARDPLVFTVVAGVLAAGSLAACLLPALRASQLSPLTILRAE
jgi:putative ABC transport system permease protein